MLEETPTPEVTPGPQDTSATPADKPDVDPKVKAFVTMWTARIKNAKKNPRIEKAFERMDKCMQLAKDGAPEDWLKDDKNYVVPILNRHVNQAVAQLYAKNPRAYAQRKKRRMFQVWDGELASLNEAGEKVKAASMVDPTTGQPLAPMDPNAMAIMADAERVKAYDVLMDGLAETMTILHNHYMQDQSAQYKQQFKSLVRRTKVCGVGYVKLCFQRILEKNPDVTVKITDATEQLATLQAMLASKSRDEFDDDSAKMEQLRTLLADLQQNSELIVQEGPLYAFPKAKAIIIDPACTHLKTLTGAGWYAEEFEKTPTEVEEDFKKNIRGNYTEYKPDDKANVERWSDTTGEKLNEQPAKVWRVMNRKTQQEFTICEGYDDYLKAPSAPAVKVRRFWDIFPLVFNEIEDEKDLYPPSDVWLARHLQLEYNRSREFLREHRMMNRPAWLAAKGVFEETDLDKLSSHSLGAILELNALAPGDKVQDKIMAKPMAPLDPKQYEVESIFSDLLRTVGSQQANLGPTEGGTATESSIAEHSRTVALADNVDDLDDLLSQLAQATGELMLREVTKDTVMQIVGPGAVWPDMPQTREEVAEEIVLDVRAGSSGRPNQAAELAKMERAMPFILQLPNVNPIPPAQKYLDLLEIDAESTIIEGLPSITALNGMMAKPAVSGGSTEPGAQGAQGASNAPQAPGTPPGPQAAHPAPQIVA